MTTTKSPVMQFYADGDWPDPRHALGRLKCLGRSGKITLAAQADGDDIDLFKLPRGCIPLFGLLHASATLGTSTIAIGIAGSTGKYRAAAVHTAVIPTLFGVAAGMGDALSAEELVKLYNTTAALPGSGTLEVSLFGLMGD